MLRPGGGCMGPAPSPTAEAPHMPIKRLSKAHQAAGCDKQRYLLPSVGRRDLQFAIKDPVKQGTAAGCFISIKHPINHPVAGLLSE